VTDFVGNVAASDNIPVEALKFTPAQLWSSSFAGSRLLKKAGKTIHDVSGIGVGLPVHRFSSGIAFWSPVFANPNVDFRELLQLQI